MQRHAYEIKMGKTIHPDFFNGFYQFQKIAPDTHFHLVYGGDMTQKRNNIDVHSFEGLFA
jgi:hypothetical protein